MLRSATDFNVDIAPWDVSNGVQFELFLGDASSFSHVLCSKEWITITMPGDGDRDNRKNHIFPGIRPGAGPAYNLSTELCCPRGQESNGQGMCHDCPSGTFKSIHYTNSASASCSPCPSGRYANATGMASPDDCTGLCPAGYYGNILSSFRANVSESCLLCPSGRASLPGKAASVLDCNACGFGSKLVATVPVLQCSTCESGTFLDGLALSSNIACKACPSGRVTCENENQCGFGKEYFGNASQRNVLNHRDINSCHLCSLGRVFQDRVAPSSCVVCPGGRYQDIQDVAARHCKNCVAGKFLADDGEDFSQHDSKRDCIQCKTKTWSLGGERFCSQCAVGRYELTDEGGIIGGCEDCLPGFFSANPGSEICDACSAGLFQNNRGLPYCLPCVQGRFSSLAGQAEWYVGIDIECSTLRCRVFFLSFFYFSCITLFLLD